MIKPMEVQDSPLAFIPDSLEQELSEENTL